TPPIAVWRVQRPFHVRRLPRVAERPFRDCRASCSPGLCPSAPLLRGLAARFRGCGARSVALRRRNLRVVDMRNELTALRTQTKGGQVLSVLGGTAAADDWLIASSPPVYRRYQVVRLRLTAPWVRGLMTDVPARLPFSRSLYLTPKEMTALHLQRAG